MQYFPGQVRGYVRGTGCISIFDCTTVPYTVLPKKYFSLKILSLFVPFILLSIWFLPKPLCLIPFYIHPTKISGSTSIIYIFDFYFLERPHQMIRFKKNPFVFVTPYDHLL